MKPTKIQSAGYNITCIAQPGENGPRVLWEDGAGLTIATRTYIRNTYGQAVLDALKTLLDGLASPQGLATFINEDPDVVCSLGLSVEGVTMPIRWLVGDGASWIVTDTKNSLDMQVEVKVNNIQFTDIQQAFVGTDNLDKATGNIVMRFSDTIQAITNNYYIRKQFNTFNTPHVLLNDVANNKFYFDGIDDGTKGSGTDYPAGANIMVFKIDGFTALKCWESYCKITKSNVVALNLVPFVSPSRNGMLDIHDLENPVFYPNAGTGTFTTEVAPHL